MPDSHEPRVPRPPRFARWLLQRRLTGATGSYLMGDLEERFSAIAGESPVRARLWYWRQTLPALLLPVPGAVGTPPGSSFGDLRADVRSAVRSLRRRPGETLVAVLPLGLGIGVVATAFSIAWGTVVAGLPFEEADRLVHFERARLADGQLSLAVTPHDYLAWRETQRSFEDLGAYVEREVTFPSEGAPPERYEGIAISPNSFDLLRVSPALGRGFTDDEAAPGSDAVIILSHGLWSRRFAADPTVVGSTVPVSGRPTTIVGVMPEGFGFPIAEEFWVPLRIDLTQTQRGSGRLDVFGRLRPGKDIASARADFDGITGRLGDAYPDTNGGITASLRSFEDEYVGEEFSRTIVRLVVGSLLLLLVCCANVANLLLVRGFRRRRELAVRRALGATHGTLVRQLVAEAGALSFLGAILGLLVAWVGVDWFNRVGAGAGVFDLPHGSASLFWWNVALDGPTLLAAALAACLTAILAGIAPALRTADASRLRSRGTFGSSGLQRIIVGTQVALTSALLLAAGLLGRSAGNVQGSAEPFVADDVVVARLSLPSSTASVETYATLDAQKRFVNELLERLEGDPSIREAAFMTTLPLDRPRPAPFRVDGVPASPTPSEAGLVTVSGSFFSTFDMSPVEGRLLDPSDRGSAAPVAVVNESFRDRYLDGLPTVGSRIRLGGDESTEPWLQVVGVVPDLWHRPNAPEQQAGIYVPLEQASVGDAGLRLGPWGLAYPTLAARGATAGVLEASRIGSHVHAADPGLPLRSLETMRSVTERRLGRYRVWGDFWFAFGAAALALAALGIYGVLAFGVTLRTPEIGVRRALGASSATIQRSVVRHAVVDVGVGLVAGLILGRLLVQGMAHLLYGVDPAEPSAYAAVTLLVGVVALAASWWPATRASRIDPQGAIRAEG